ncbi:MAG: hypothetical protein AAF573_10520 [Bacteroidota bacterium]
MNFLKITSTSCLSLILLFGCTDQETSSTTPQNAYAMTTNLKSNAFKDYWYQGKAEITSYDLEQVRYGEIRQGNAVMIFVTEDFSKKKQVKLDNPSATPDDAVSVLKLNMTRKFNTGIYPYSIMQSSFTPVDLEKYPNTLKVTSSSQEWCGHTFMQLNLKKNNYESEVRSYFESEGDTKTRLNKTLLEDEIWSIIRINPNKLPQGEIDIIPSTIYARLRHIDFKNEKAIASVEEKGSETHFQLQYKNLNRTLKIVFEKAFPHQIIAWEESSRSGYGGNTPTLTTKGKRKKSIMLDYWSKNGLGDSHYRAELGLE